MSFVLYIILLALTYLRPIEAFAPELVEYRPILLFSILTLVVGIFDAIRSKGTAVYLRHVWLLVAFMTAIALSLVVNNWAGGAIQALLDFSPTAVLFLLTLFNVKSMARLKVACAVLTMCMVVLAGLGAVSFHTGFMASDLVLRQHAGDDENGEAPEEGVIPVEDSSGTIFWRVRSLGFLRDPNDFGEAIVMVLPLLAGAYRRRSRLRNLILVGIPGSVLLYGVYLTHSRGALLGIGTMLFLGLNRAIGVTRTVALMALVGAIALGGNFTGGRGFDSKEESASGRIDAWSDGLNMLKGQPILGVGYHNFTEHHELTAHNSFVLCFSELGVVGYWIWIGLLVLVILEVSQVANMAPVGTDERAWANLLRTSIFGFLTCAWFLSRTYEPGLFILLALCIAAAHCARIHSSSEWIPAQLPVKWRLKTSIVTVLSIAVVYAIVILQNAFGR
jgi:hypothetical protein